MIIVIIMLIVILVLEIMQLVITILILIVILFIIGPVQRQRGAHGGLQVPLQRHHRDARGPAEGLHRGNTTNKAQPKQTNNTIIANNQT